MKKNLLFYATVILVFSIGIYLVLSGGSQLGSGGSAPEQRLEAPAANGSASSHNIAEDLKNSLGGIIVGNLREPLSVLLLQVLMIMTVARLISSMLLKIGQPPVIGEMIAGIVLGPSLLGILFPNVMSFLFPPHSIGALKLLSQVGVILFMFVVGMEINAQQLREKARAAVVISHASIITPFFLGVSASLLIYHPFAPSNVPFTSFALF